MCEYVHIFPDSGAPRVLPGYGQVGVPPAVAVAVWQAAVVAVASTVDEAVNVTVGVFVGVGVGGVSDPATLVRNWLVITIEVWVAATAV
jgi:hypothetical protein